MARIRCSFCGKGEDEVGHLVTGPRKVAICAECVAVCAQVDEHSSPYDGDALLTGIGTLVTNDRYVDGVLGPIPDGAVAIRQGVVRWAGPERALPDKYRDLPELPCGGRVVVPGLVDAHGPGPSPGGDPTFVWHASLERGVTTVAAVCDPARIEAGVRAGFEAMPEVGLLADGWVGPLPEGPVRSIGDPGREVDWVRIPGDAEPVSAVSASERTDPRGYAAERFDEPSVAALGATRRAVVALPTGIRAGGDLRPLWRRSPVALGSGGTAEYGGNADMAVAIWLATRDLHLTPEQALWSATRGSAIALDWGERGHLVRGAVGDVVVLDTDRVADVAGVSWAPWKVLRAGVAV